MSEKAENLKCIQECSGLNLGEFAMVLGVSLPTLRRYESEDHQLNPLQELTLCNMGVNKDFLSCQSETMLSGVNIQEFRRRAQFFYSSL